MNTKKLEPHTCETLMPLGRKKDNTCGCDFSLEELIDELDKLKKEQRDITENDRPYGFLTECKYCERRCIYFGDFAVCPRCQEVLCTNCLCKKGIKHWFPIEDYLYGEITKEEIYEKYIISSSDESNSSDESTC
jgi:hypothetical protein